MADDDIAVQITANIDDLSSNMGAAAETTTEAMDQIGAAGQKAGESLDSGITAAADKAKEKLQEVGEESGNLGEAFDGLKDKIHTAFEAGGILVAAEAVAKVSEALQEAMAHAVELSNMAEVLGINVQQFQALESAANQAGVGISIVSRTAIKLKEDLAEARDGSATAEQKLFDLGITLADIQDKAFGENEALAKVADNLRNTATATDTMAGFTKDFGSRAALVVEALRNYHGSLAGVNEEMTLTNGYTSQQIAQLKEAHEGWTIMSERISNSTGKLAAWTAGLLESYKAAVLAKNPQLGADASGDEAQVAASNKTADAQVEAAKRVELAEVEAAKDAVEATKSGSEEKVAAEVNYVEKVISYYGQKSDAARKAVADEGKAQQEYTDKMAEDYKRAVEETTRNQQKEDRDKEESVKKSVSEMDKDYKTFFDNLTKQQIDQAQGTEKVTIAQLDSAKKILDAQNQSKSISPDTYLQAEIVIINERRDAEIKMYQDIAAARAGDKDSALKEQQDIAVANAQAATQIVAAQQKASQEVLKNWQAVDGPIESAFDSAFKTMLTTTTSFTNNVRKLFTTLSTDLITGVFDKLVKTWVEGEATKLESSQAMQAVLNALHLTGLVTAKATDAAMATSDITTKAAQAAAGAFAATAAIPYVGPFLAPAAAAEADASVMAFTAQIASAAGGMVVDRDQLAMVHEDEMILPKNISQGINEKILNSDTEGGDRGNSNTYHVSAHDAKSFEKYLSSQRNRNSVAKALKKTFTRGANGNRNLRHP
jgi:hypothetical protein